MLFVFVQPNFLTSFDLISSSRPAAYQIPVGRKAAVVLAYLGRDSSLRNLETVPLFYFTNATRLARIRAVHPSAPNLQPHNRFVTPLQRRPRKI